MSKFVDFLDHYKTVLWCLVATAGVLAAAGGWATGRVAEQVEDALVPLEAQMEAAVDSIAEKIERQTIAFNMLRCEIKGISLLDCPYDEGLDP